MDPPVTGRFRRWLVRDLCHDAAAAKKHELHRAAVQHRPQRPSSTAPQHCSSSVIVQPPMPPGFRGTWADLNRLNDAASDPSTLVHSHHTGIPALEWIT